MTLRQLSPRELDTWPDAIFSAALEERPLPPGHPLSWSVLEPITEFKGPVFSDPNLSVPQEAAE